MHGFYALVKGPARVAIFADAAEDKPLAEATLPPIPAPNDLLAKFTDARFDLPRATLAQSWSVAVQPAPGLEDSNPSNNTRSGQLP